MQSLILSVVVFHACCLYVNAELPYCAANSSLKYCIRPCPLTCQNKDLPRKCDQPRCSEETLYKCECDFGYVLFGDRCILEADCPAGYTTEIQTNIEITTLGAADLLVEDIEDGSSRDDSDNASTTASDSTVSPQEDTSSDKSVSTETPNDSSVVTSSATDTTST